MSKSMAVAIVALFFSLTGWGVAAKVALAPPNTVGTQQIVNRSVRLADMHPSAVRLLKGQKGDQGDVGPQGLPGLRGATGPAGVADLSTLSRITSIETRLSSAEKVADAVCSKYGLPHKVVTDVSLSYTGYLSIRTVDCPFR